MVTGKAVDLVKTQSGLRRHDFGARHLKNGFADDAVSENRGKGKTGSIR